MPAKRKAIIESPSEAPSGNGMGDHVPGDPVADLFRANANNKQSDKALEFKAAVEALYSKISLNMKSVLNDRQVLAMTRALIFADRYKSPTMLLAVNDLLELSISKVSEKGSTGSGRFDLREVLKSMIGNRNETDAAALGKKLMGE